MAKTALITGGSGGIGYALSRLFARDGYTLVLVARNERKLAEKATQIRQDFDVDVHYIAQDLSAAGAADAVIESFDDLGIHIDALVNNAGFGEAGRFVLSDWERQQALLNVNIMVLTKLSHEFGARMAKRGHGEILNIASIASFMAGPYMDTYYASKAYVHSFTTALHTELAPYGVAVTALCPGPVRTNFFNNAGFGRLSLFDTVGMDPEAVAEAGYLALKANAPERVPGIFPKAAVLFTRVAPQCLMRGIVSALQKGAADKVDGSHFPRPS